MHYFVHQLAAFLVSWFWTRTVHWVNQRQLTQIRTMKMNQNSEMKPDDKKDSL